MCETFTEYFSTFFMTYISKTQLTEYHLTININATSTMVALKLSQDSTLLQLYLEVKLAFLIFLILKVYNFEV